MAQIDLNKWLIGYEAAAKYASVSTGTIVNRVREGSLKPVRLRKQTVLFHIEDLERIKLRKRGVKPGPRKPEVVKQIREMAKAELSLRKIAKNVGLSYERVRYYLGKMKDEKREGDYYKS